ncbi:hypothetical protein F4779DRAFT_421338 [Xylariaceae sp. FL0662B]|nr:hypothetical protein F4779DRAFT_421338 [Xylariaceae sp. FL0662B]
MSIDLNWETLTGGPDGEALAERIRDFIHTKFQSVPLPRFIKSVTVHEFQFGNIPPRVVLKDLCDPLPDFYEENPDVDDDDEDEDEQGGNEGSPEYIPDSIRAAEYRRRADQIRRLEGRGASRSGIGSPPPEGPFPPHIHVAGLRSAPATPDMGNPFLGLGVPTPGIPGGTSNIHYFQSKLATGWSGTHTPLAAVAGAQHLNSWLDMSSPQSPSAESYVPSNAHSHSPSRHSSVSQGDPSGSLAPGLAPPPLREKHSVSTLAPTSAEASRPPTRDASGGSALLQAGSGSAVVDVDEYGRAAGRGRKDEEEYEGAGQDEPRQFREPRPDDLQAVFRIRYAGDIRLMLTAEILLDYPMPSFVGIPVRLNITGLTFDGVGVVAYIRRRVHFCFLSPEDALAAVGADDDDDEEEAEQRQQQDGSGRGGGGGGGEGRGADANATTAGGASARSQRGRLGGLLQEIRVESEIGQRDGAKQSLKNVGKVEKFVLEQVRRIFEEEFVYPSFWTFLV